MLDKFERTITAVGIAYGGFELANGALNVVEINKNLQNKNNSVSTEISQPRNNEPTVKVSVGDTIFDCKPEITNPITGEKAIMHFKKHHKVK